MTSPAYHWPNIVRTGRNEDDTPQAQTYTPDPAAVAHLHELVGHEQRRKRPKPKAEPARGIIANLFRAQARRADEAFTLPADELRAVIDEHCAGLVSVNQVAARYGVSHGTITRAFHRAGYLYEYRRWKREPSIRRLPVPE